MILDRYLVKQFVPVFFIAMSMFVLLLSMIDLFANLVRYLNYGVSARNIFLISYYYLPKSISFAMPISLLFAAAYTLGDLYARNELTSIFAAGIPFWRFSVPLLIIGLGTSVFSFYFNDQLVIPTFKMKNDLTSYVLDQVPTDENRTDIVIRARGGALTYTVDFFDLPAEILNGFSVIEWDENGHLLSIIRARSARWTGTYWELSSPIIYEWEDGFLRYRIMEGTDQFREEPDTFRRNMVNVEELGFVDARLLVRDLQAAGLPYVEELAEYHHRFSFASVSFVVIFLSISMGGRFRKNILLMSLLSSLAAAVVFYVMEMISMMLAKTGYIAPMTGAWFPVITFTLVGLILLRTAKT